MLTGSAQSIKLANVPLTSLKNVYKLSFFEWLFAIMCISAPLQLYNIRFAGMNWSVDRILLVLLLLMLPVYKQKHIMRIGLAQLLGIMGCLSLIMSMLTGDGADAYFMEVAPSFAQGMIIFSIGSYVIKDNPKALKIITFIALGWLVIFSVFSVYMLYYYYVKGETSVPYPFFGYDIYYAPQILSMMRSRRLFMPLASAPHLGAGAGFMGLFFLCVYLRAKRLYAILPGMLFVLICMLTLSRGPLLSLALSFLVLFGMGIIMRVVRLNQKLVIMLLICLTMIGGFRYYKHFQIEKEGRTTTSRMTIDVGKIMQSRHLELKLYAFSLLEKSSIPQLLFGQGFGAFEKDGIGAYSFTGYLTLLVETGLYGSTIFILILVLPILKAWWCFVHHRKCDVWMFYVFCMGIYLFCCHLFYELKTVREVWIAAGIIYGLAFTRTNYLIMETTWLMDTKSERTMPPIRR